MARTKVSIDGLADEITRVLKEYNEDVEQGMEKAQRKVGREGVKTLKATSPANRPKYKDGWRVSKTPYGLVVHNATYGSLTHLLEKGHALRNGGRSRAFPHIKPVEEQIIADYEKEVVRVIKNG